MIVRLDGTITGTIGGSAVEALVIKEAITSIEQGKTRRITYNLDDIEKTSTGMICGGIVEFFIEPLKRFPRLYIFGGGHVGLSLANIVAQLGYPYLIFEDRQEFATAERFPQAADCRIGNYSDLTAENEFLQPAFVVIVTRSHDTDYEVLKGVLRKPFEYLGMICSRRKKAQMWKKLQADGFSEEELDRVHAPIGLEIGANTPAEIAVSIISEIISIFHKSKK